MKTDFVWCHCWHLHDTLHFFSETAAWNHFILCMLIIVEVVFIICEPPPPEKLWRIFCNSFKGFLV